MEENEKEETPQENDGEGEFVSAAVNPKQVMITDEELRGLQKELLDYKDKYLRQLADTENARKRMQKEREELIRYAMENLIVEFLNPLDNLDNALRVAQDMSEEVRNWAFGFQMILAQFKDVLAQNGVTPVASLGAPFDPHLHEAIEMVESADQKPGTITEECVRGYKMGERTIRPARVKVAKAKETETTKEN